jgi:hypothetical protein
MGEVEGPPGETVDATAGLRWFVSAPADTDLGPLLGALERRGAQPYVLSDVAALGANLLQSVQQAIASADHVLIVLGDAEGSLNSAFEAGMAVGLGKPLVVVAAPQVVIPADLSSALTVRARPDDLDAINFALDQAKGRTAAPTGLASATGHPLGNRADPLLDRAIRILALSEPAAIEREAIEILVQALEDSGTVPVQSPRLDQAFDVGVWSEDLDAIAANPLLIELKQTLSESGVRQALTALHAIPNARVALIVYLDPTSTDVAVVQRVRFPVLAIALQDLIGRMRNASFAEVVRDLRNRSIHGIPTI